MTNVPPLRIILIQAPHLHVEEAEYIWANSLDESNEIVNHSRSLPQMAKLACKLCQYIFHDFRPVPTQQHQQYQLIQLDQLRSLQSPCLQWQRRFGEPFPQ